MDLIEETRTKLDAGADHDLTAPMGDSLESIVEQLEHLAQVTR